MTARILKPKLFNIFFIIYIVIILITSFSLYKYTNVLIVNLIKQENIENEYLKKENIIEKVKLETDIRKFNDYLYQNKLKKLDFAKIDKKILSLNTTFDKYNKTYIIKINYAGKIKDSDKLELRKYVEDEFRKLANESINDYIEFKAKDIHKQNLGNTINTHILLELTCQIYENSCNDVKLFIETDNKTKRTAQLKKLLEDQNLQILFKNNKYTDTLFSFYYLKNQLENLNDDKSKIIENTRIDLTIKDFSKINKTIFYSFVVFLLVVPLFVRKIFK